MTAPGVARAAVLGLLMLVLPAAAWACPGCLSSPFGDRTFGWAYLSLFAAPFVIGSSIAGVIAYCYRRQRYTAETTPASAPMSGRQDLPPLEKETT